MGRCYCPVASDACLALVGIIKRHLQTCETDCMQYGERGALFVFDPDRERQCFAIGTNCKRVASHLTRPHRSHSPSHLNLASTRSHTHSHTHNTLAHVRRTPISAPDWLPSTLQPARTPPPPWPQPPRDPCSKQVRSSQFPSTRAVSRRTWSVGLFAHGASNNNT